MNAGKVYLVPYVCSTIKPTNIDIFFGGTFCTNCKAILALGLGNRLNSHKRDDTIFYKNRIAPCRRILATNIDWCYM